MCQMKQLFCSRSDEQAVPVATVQMYTGEAWQETPVYKREDLQPGECISGPAIIIEATGTNVIEPNWQAELTERNHLILKRSADTQLPSQNPESKIQNRPDPVMLEIFNNLFRAIAQANGYHPAKY